LKETKLSTTLKGFPLQPISGHTKEILYIPNKKSLGVDVIPPLENDIVPTLLQCEKGRPLVYKVHNLDAKTTNQWVGTWTGFLTKGSNKKS
jgi:hypothetical protein